tara:strand:- start:107 stop:289 length:183 start_codon:yes stop_codon:yes gene_type:complete
MKQYNELDVNAKIMIKQHAINLYGKRWHTAKPDFCSKLNELQIVTVLSLSNTNQKKYKND